MGVSKQAGLASSASHVGTCELAHRESAGIKIVWIPFQGLVGSQEELVEV